MRTSYVLLCNEQAPREFPRRRFLEVRRGSLKLYTLPPERTGIIQTLSMMGLIFVFLVCLRPVYILLAYLPPSWRYLGLVFAPLLILWLQKSWQWSVQIAFHYSKEPSNIGTDIQPAEVKVGFLRQKLQVGVEGRRTVLSIVCRRRTLSEALRLAVNNSRTVFLEEC